MLSAGSNFVFVDDGGGKGEPLWVSSVATLMFDWSLYSGTWSMLCGVRRGFACPYMYIGFHGGGGGCCFVVSSLRMIRRGAILKPTKYHPLVGWFLMFSGLRKSSLGSYLCYCRTQKFGKIRN